MAYYGEVICARRAVRALAGLGDPDAGQWREWSGFAFHLRRRLSVAEAAEVGEVLDIRGTPEAARRARALGRHLDAVPVRVQRAELGP